MTQIEMRKLIAKTHYQIARNVTNMSDKEITYYYTAVANLLLSSCESWAREEFIESIEENKND